MTRSPLRRPLADHLADHLAALLADEDGSVTIEALLIFPLLCWAYLGTFVFFDGVHAQAVNVRSASTIADILSRESIPITPEYVDSMFALQAALQGGTQPRRLRVTIFQYQADGDKFRVVRSEQRGGATTLTTAQLTALRARIPPMNDLTYGILVDTWRVYAPPKIVGIPTITMSESMVVQPRDGPLSYCFNTNNDDPTNVSTLVC